MALKPLRMIAVQGMRILGQNENGHWQNPLWNASQPALMLLGEVREIVVSEANLLPADFQEAEDD